MVVLLALVSLSGCVGEATHELDTVKVASVPVISNAPLFIADEEGYFAEQGIKVEFVKFSTSGDQFPALIAGQIDVCVGPVIPAFFNVNLKGTDKVMIVADKGHDTPDSCPSSAIVVRKDLYDSGAIRTPADLKGKHIANPQGEVLFMMSKVLSAANLTEKDLEMNGMTFPMMVAAYENKAIDGSTMTEPYVTQVVMKGQGVVLVKAGDVTPNSSRAVFYGPTLVEKNRDLGERFMVAYLKGVRKYNEGKTDRNIQILRNATKLDTELLKNACWVPMSPDGHVEPAPLMEYQQFVYGLNMTSRMLPADELLDMSFAEKATKVLDGKKP